MIDFLLRVRRINSNDSGRKNEMLQLYYGDGKGKTSASIGAAIRCVGSGMKVLFVQFLKNGDSSECEILRQINGISLNVSDARYKLMDHLDPEKKSVHREGYEKVWEQIQSSAEKYDMIVLDELLDAIFCDYLDEKKIYSFLSKEKENREIIVTGHQCIDWIEQLSDYVSEVRAIKHPYDKGTVARKGIEF